MQSLTVQQQHVTKVIPDDKNHSYLWGLLKGLCNFYGLTFLAEVLCFLVSRLLSHLNYMGNVAATYLSLLLCPVWSRSWISSLPKYFLCPFFWYSLSVQYFLLQFGSRYHWTDKPAVAIFIGDQNKISSTKRKVWIWPASGSLKDPVCVLVSRVNRRHKQVPWQGILGELQIFTTSM